MGYDIRMAWVRQVNPVSLSALSHFRVDALEHVVGGGGRLPVDLEAGLEVAIRNGATWCQLPSILQQLADEAIEGGCPLLRGDVIGPRGVLAPDTSLEAFYVYAPVYQPDEFAVCESPDGPIVIAWLIPLFAEEANFGFTHGWQALEELLIEHDPDVVDWQRAPLPVH